MGTSRALISGTAHRIIEGRVLISGTAYAIYQGKTLIGGTAKDIILTSFINAIPAMTSNSAGASPGGTCSSSNSATTAWRVFDNNNSTTNTFTWTTAKGTAYTHWSQYVVPSGYTLQFNGLNVRVNRTSTSVTAFSWSVQISQNGSTWTTIASGTNVQNGAVSLTQVYFAKYIRLVTSVTYNAAASRSVNHYHLQTSMCTGCSTTCTGSCSGGCSGCGSGCAGGCTGCGSGCSSGCEGSCTGCTGGCQGGCNNTCQGVCASGCSNGCDNICDSGCAFGCVSGCSDQCYGVVN